MSAGKERHLEAETLLRLAEGAVAAPGDERHLDRCAGCAKRLGEAARIVADMRADRGPEPSEALLRRTASLFLARPSRSRRLGDVVEKVARLVRGQALERALAGAGVRGEAGLAVPMRFAAAPFEIELTLERLDTGTRVTGQVVAVSAAELPVLVLVSAEHGRETLAAVPLDDHGYFEIDALPAPPFDLVLDAGRRRIRLHLPARS